MFRLVTYEDFHLVTALKLLHLSHRVCFCLANFQTEFSLKCAFSHRKLFRYDFNREIVLMQSVKRVARANQQSLFIGVCTVLTASIDIHHVEVFVKICKMRTCLTVLEGHLGLMSSHVNQLKVGVKLSYRILYSPIVLKVPRSKQSFRGVSTRTWPDHRT